MSKNVKQKLPWQQFRTRNPDIKRVFLDIGRAEVIFSMICAPDLTDERLAECIGAAFGASNGDPAVLQLAIEAFSDWPEIDADALTRKIEQLWKAFETRAPDVDCRAILRRIFSEQPLRPSTSRIEAIFDDPSFDFVAYLDWHNS
jgi:hypothetical protein